jgi:hypothetical protein
MTSLIQSQNDEPPVETERSRAGDMSLMDKISMWDNLRQAATPDIKNCELFEGLEEEEEVYDEDKDGDEEDDNDGIITIRYGPLPYTKYLHSNPAYDWFIATLQKECLLTRDDTTGCVTVDDDNLLSAILRHLPQGRISKQQAPYSHCVTFCVPWAPIEGRVRSAAPRPWQSKLFLGKGGGIGNLITVTVCGTQALACSVNEYVEKSWPFGGSLIIDALQELVEDRSSQQHGKAASHSSMLTKVSVPNVRLLKANFPIEPNSRLEFMLIVFSLPLLDRRTRYLSAVNNWLGWLQHCNPSRHSHNHHACWPLTARLP